MNVKKLKSFCLERNSAQYQKLHHLLPAVGEHPHAHPPKPPPLSTLGHERRREIVLKVQMQTLAGLITEHINYAAAPSGVCVKPVCPVVTLS